MEGACVSFERNEIETWRQQKIRPTQWKRWYEKGLLTWQYKITCDLLLTFSLVRNSSTVFIYRFSTDRTYFSLVWFYKLEFMCIQNTKFDVEGGKRSIFMVCIYRWAHVIFSSAYARCWDAPVRSFDEKSPSHYDWNRNHSGHNESHQAIH